MMSTTTVTLTRWHCDVCDATIDNPEADESEIPSGWGCLAVSTPDSPADEPLQRDLCPTCLSAVLILLKA